MIVESPNIPNKYLYHYTSSEITLSYILPEKRIRFSPINETNDPQESNRRFFSLSDDANILPKHKIISDFLNQEIFSNTLIRDIKIFCFTQDVGLYNRSPLLFGDLPSKPRMWAQYASLNKGVCLIFDKKKLTELFYTHFSDIPLKMAKDVVYDISSERVCDAYCLNTSELLNSSIESVALKRIRTFWDIYYFTKHPDWKDENEYRFLINYDNAQYAYLDIESCLLGVVLGVNFSQDLISKVKSYLEEYNNPPALGILQCINNTYSVTPTSEQYCIQ